MELACLQVNVQHSRLASQLLENKLISPPYLGFITESYVVSNKVVVRPSRYKIIPSGVLDDKPRVALIIPPGLKYVSLGIQCHPDCAVAQVSFEGSTIIVASIYLDYNLDVVQSWFENLVQYSVSNNFKLRIGIVTCSVLRSNRIKKAKI